MVQRCSIRFLTVLIFSFVSCALLSQDSHAGCTKDTDCKGDRICENGQCVSPRGNADHDVSEFNPNIHYMLIANHNGKVLDVGLERVHNPAVPRSDLDNVLVYQRHNGDNQKWKIEKLSGGYYRLICVHNGKALDVGLNDVYNPANPRSKRDNVLVYKWHGGDNQRWKIERLDDGSYRLTAKHNGKALDVGLEDRHNPAVPNSDRDNVLVYGWHGGKKPAVEHRGSPLTARETEKFFMAGFIMIKYLRAVIVNVNTSSPASFF